MGPFFAGLILVGLGAASCSDGGAPPETGPDDGPPYTRNELLDLALREPDDWVRDTGALVPDLDHGLGAADLGGWEESTSTVEGVDSPLLWTRARRAAVLLERSESGAARITLELVGPEARTSVKVTARLNGSVVGEFDVPEGPMSVELETPKDAWRPGRNVLEFDAEGFSYIARDESSWGSKFRTFGLVSLKLGRGRAASHAPGRLTLADHTAARYVVEEGPVGTLRIVGRTNERGALAVRFGARGPARESVLGWSTRELFDLEPQEAFDLRVDSRASLGTLGVVEVGWFSESDASDPRVDGVVVSQLVLERQQRGVVPPILFFSIDTLSARNMSVYGYERDTTPRLAELARDAVVFETARANSPWTVPSYLSQLTGLLPEASWSPDSSLGAQPKLIGWEGRSIAPQRWTFPELLRARGYRTFAAVDNPWLNKIPGLEQGFETYDIAPSLIGLADRSGGIELVLSLSRAELDRSGRVGLEGRAPKPTDTRPYFHFLQALDVHGPYLPGPGSAELFGAQELARTREPQIPIVGAVGAVFGGVKRVMLKAFGEEVLDRGSIAGAAVQALYDEGVHEVDAKLGAYFDWLKEQGLYDDALIIVTADHGEQMDANLFMFDHGMPYEHTSLVPLIVKFPGSEHAGRRITTPVELVDLYATLADLVGVLHEGRHLDGRSLLDLLDEDSRESRPTFLLDGSSGTRAVVDGDWKLVVHLLAGEPLETVLSYPGMLDAWTKQDPETARALADGLGVDELPDRLITSQLSGRLGPEVFRRVDRSVRRLEGKLPRMELYDLANDPEERTNLADRYPDRVQRMAFELLQAYRRQLRLRMDSAMPIVRSLGADEQRVLEELGYAVGED
jgi:arylsulfatase A-like enzyme